MSDVRLVPWWQRLGRCPCCGQRLDGKTQAMVADEQREAIQRFLDRGGQQ